MKIAICGSMSLSKEMLEAKSELENLGHEVLVPVHSEKYAELGSSDNESGESAKIKLNKI